jgi:hypothetical protein
MMAAQLNEFVELATIDTGKAVILIMILIRKRFYKLRYNLTYICKKSDNYLRFL